MKKGVTIGVAVGYNSVCRNFVSLACFTFGDSVCTFIARNTSMGFDFVKSDVTIEGSRIPSLRCPRAKVHCGYLFTGAPDVENLEKALSCATQRL